MNGLDEPGAGLKRHVSWPLIVVALYTVVAGVGIPVAANFFPDSLLGRIFRLPTPWSGVLWWVALLVPALLIGSVGEYVQRRRAARKGAGEIDRNNDKAK